MREVFFGGYMKRIRLVAFSAIALGACAHNNLRKETGWSEVRTEHLVVATYLDPRAAAEAVEQLERVELGLLQRWWPGGEIGGRPLNVVLLGWDGAIGEFATRGVGGYYSNVGGLNGAFMVATADENGLARRFNAQLVVKHELTHHLLVSVMRQVPLWVNEGFATYMEGLELDREHDLLRIGKPSPQRLTELSNNVSSSMVRTRADMGDWSPADVRNVMNALSVPDRGFEARAWQLFFHLANAHPEELDAYLRLLWTGETNAQAAKKALAELTPEILARELTSRYRAHSIAYSFTELPLPRLSTPARIRPMAPAEMHAQLAELLWTAEKPQARKRAEPEARAALATDPLNVKALAVLAGLGVKEGATLERCRAAAAAHPSDLLAGRLLARLLNGPDDAKERREILERSARLAPDDPGILNSLAWDYVRQGKGRSALAIAQAAADLAPDSAEILDTLAATLAQAERCPEAVEKERLAIQLAPRGDRWAAAQKRLAAYETGCKAVPLE